MPETAAWLDLLRPLARVALREGAQRFPLLSGFGTLANTPPFVWATNEDVVVETKLRDGSALFVHRNDYIGRSAYYFGDFDPKVSWLCRSTLRPGDLMLDIGGNYGLVAMIAARLVGPTGSVHVFEPQLDLIELMRRSVERNDYKQVTVHAIGLSSTDGELAMSIPEINRGMGSVELTRGGRHVTVQLRRGSEYLTSVLGERRPRLVKLDVEGHESEVFLGASEWIERVQPEVWLFEHNQDGLLWDLPGLEVLRRIGYRFYGVPKAKMRMRVVPLRAGQRTQPEYNDLVAVHPNSDWTPPLRG